MSKQAVTIQNKQFQTEEISGCCLWEENLIQSRDERAKERVLQVAKPWSSLELAKQTRGGSSHHAKKEQNVKRHRDMGDDVIVGEYLQLNMGIAQIGSLCGDKYGYILKGLVQPN